MKKLYPLLLSLLACCLLQAQDTIMVQTFQLSDEARAGVFEFPDDPNQSYEKILMLYQMRCHDAQVGNGNVGCREWDYSCNTFITDSTRVDSNRAVHPTHTISNFSGEEFAFTSQPNYSYVQYEQIAVNYTDTLSESIATIEDHNYEFSLTDNLAPTKIQSLYRANELSNEGLTAGMIHALKLRVTEAGSELAFLRVRLKHTTKTSLSTDDPDLDGFTEVYFLHTQFMAEGQHSFKFHTPFEWDGTSNLLVEFSFMSDETTTASKVRVHDADFDGTLITGPTDHYLEFSGAGTVPVEASNLSNIQDEITISLWTYGDGEALPVASTLFEGEDADGLRQVNVHLPWANGQVYWDCGNDGTGYDRINIAADPSAWQGQWNHWAFTKNANTGDMRIYLNGELFHSGTGKFKAIDIAAFNLGSNVEGNLSYFGAMDEVRIWDKALDQATIQAWMHRSLSATHPHVFNLKTYYRFDEGEGIYIENYALDGIFTTYEGLPNWQTTRGKDLFKRFVTSNFRPNLSLVQGEFSSTQTVIPVLDSTLNNQHQVTVHGLDGTDLITTNNFFTYQAGMNYVYNEAGMIIDSVFSAAENTIVIGELEYFDKFPAKYEILSLVTPYGNGLDLGPDGKTFTFDVTDFTPILKGKKRLSIEMGGQNQEELDLKFLFITGTPAREVKDIQNIWPFRRGYFAGIQSDAVFEPRAMQLLPDATQYKIRSSITGHGQNGEFVERTHYLNVDGGANEFEFPVWKACGNIPIFPQGGTWLFDRAGWCPGDPTMVHHSDITPYVTAGQSVELDYGVLGGPMDDANYLVAHQLVSYGPPNFNNDAAIVDVIRPSNKVEHERFNPACNLPVVRIQNKGANPLTSLELSYKVQGGEALSYTWTGNLEMMETAEVTLPVPDVSFWQGLDMAGIFEVSLSNPNGAADEYAQNNQVSSSFRPFRIFDGVMSLRYLTNNRPEENRVFITDAAGAVVLERDNMQANTVYVDEFDLPYGCYTMHITDSGGDGLSYWYWAATGVNAGTGFIRFEELLNGTVNVPVLVMESEFGSALQFDFYLPEPVSTDNPTEEASLISIFPNPTRDEVNVSLVGFEYKDLTVELYDAAGRQLLSQEFINNQEKELQTQFNLGAYAKGMYMLRIFDGKKVRYRKLIKS